MGVSSEQSRRHRRRFIHPIIREVEIKHIQDSGTPLARARDGDDTSTLLAMAMEKKRTRPYLTTEYSDPKMVGFSGMPKKLRRTDSISDLCLMRSIASEFIPGYLRVPSLLGLEGEATILEDDANANNHKVETKVVEVRSSGVMVHTEDNSAGLSLLQDLVQLRLD